METPQSSPSVLHDPAARRFEIRGAGAAAVLDYERSGAVAVIVHTEVPPELRGRGLAEALVRSALAWAQAEGLKVEPRCSYAERFIDRHPQFQGLLAPGRGGPAGHS